MRGRSIIPMLLILAACGDGAPTGGNRNQSSDCVSCHQATYLSTTAPEHAAAGFATVCTNCHTNNGSWRSTWQHPTDVYQFTGAHSPRLCRACHADGVYRGKGTDCVTCHQKTFDTTTAPNHRSAGFPTRCADCHNTTAWIGAVAKHAQSMFALTGKHVAVSCLTCHADGMYAGKSTACASCHQAKYDATTNPKHSAASFSTGCTECHTTDGFQPATWTHPATAFQFTGPHAGRTCAGCHADGIYNGKGTACIACHRTTYDTTSSPAHAVAGFPTTCTDCHTPTTWLGATADHAKTLFPLTGKHLTVQCKSCHADGVYKGRSTACASCHTATYDTTSAPAHAAAGFPTTCATCHTTAGFRPATWSHPATTFPFTGAHVGRACAACHADGVYKGRSTLCIACHRTTYDTTSNPAHGAAGFPTTCADCHTTTKWLGATFDHDAKFFPIRSGVHNGKWAACTDCHVNPASYAVFSCFSCHKHNQTDMDSKHRDISGYAYDSNKCYGCHPRGVPPK